MEELPVALLNADFEVESYNGGGEEQGYPVENILQITKRPHCTKSGKEFDLVLKCKAEEGVTLTHFMIRGGENCTAPLKNGVVWFYESKPDISTYTENYKADYDQAAFDKDTSEYKPHVYFQTDQRTMEIATTLDKFYPTNYIHIKFLAPWADNNIDIGYIGLVGFKGKKHTFRDLGDIPESLNLLRPKLKRFNPLIPDFIGDIQNNPCVLLFTSSDEIKKTYEDFANKRESICNAFHAPLPPTGLGERLYGFLTAAEPKGDFCLFLTNLAAGEKFKFTEDSITTEGLTSFFDKYDKKELKPFFKSGPRPKDDADPTHPGLSIIVADSFDELVLDDSKHVFLDVYADWCGPCRAIGPKILKAAELFADMDDVVIAKMDSDANDSNKKYLPETSIPNMKLFPKGKKETPVKFEQPRTVAGIVEFILTACGITGKEDLIKKAKRMDELEGVEAKSSTFLGKIGKLVEDLTEEDGDLKEKVVEMVNAFKAKFAEYLDGDTVTEEGAEGIIGGVESGDVYGELVKVASQRKKEKDKKELKNVIKCYTKEEFDSTIQKAKDEGKLAVVDFFATWCGPCHRIAPYFADLSEEFVDVVFIKVDVDELKEVAAQCGISAMPTFQYFKDGGKIEELVGGNPTRLKELITKNK